MNQQNASMLLPEAQQQADRLFGQIGSLIEQARTQVHRAVNSAMVSCYWQIGCLIVESEQQGQTRAAYGQQLLAQLAVQLTSRFGKGFDASNLRNMRRFYLAFPIQETVSLKFGLFYGNPRLPIHDALRSEFSMISNCCLQLADQARKAAEE